MSAPLPEDYRKALGLEGEPTIAEGLTVAEERLQNVIEQLEKLPDKNPAHAKLQHDRDMLEPIVKDLRESVFGVKVDELCDAAEEALAEKPTRRAKARELLRQARREGKALPGESIYLKRIHNLEGKLDENLPTAVPPGEPTGSANTGRDLDSGATIPVKKSPGAEQHHEAGTGGAPGKKTNAKGGTVPVTPVNDDAEEIGTGGTKSTIPRGVEAGIKIGNGRFILVRELGRGGMGVVWLATDTLLQRDVAVKLLPPEVAADDMALNDLRRETIESQRLSHPHIMRVHDIYPGGKGEPAFISMEYVDGPTLRSLLVKQPQHCFAWDFLRPLVAQLCSALDYAHSERVIHRDLKPSNLMVDSKGRLKLADFGIAATMSDSMSRVSQHKEKDTSGTLNYMSPQQMRGDSPTAADDIYSLGATLYELLTSKTPFYRGDIQYQVKNEMPQKPADRIADLSITNEVPERVSDMVMSCLAKTPKERPPSAMWIMERLEGTTRTARTARSNEAQLAASDAPPTVSLKGVPVPASAGQPRSLDAFENDAPPTLPPGSLPPPPSKGKRTSTASSNIPSSPGTPPTSGGNMKFIVAGVAVAVLALLLWLAFGHKSNKPIDTASATIGTTQTAMGRIQITVQPAEAEIFGDNGSLGKGSASVTGTPGKSVKIQAKLEGYESQEKNFTFSDPDSPQSETIILKPMTTLLFVKCDSRAQIVLTRDDNGQKANVVPNPNGIPIDPGTYDVSASLNGYETAHKRVEALKPGKSYTVDLQGLVAQSADLIVMATPQSFRLTVNWDGLTHSYGTGGKANNLPVGKNLLVTIQNDATSASTNIVLSPGETTVNFGSLAVAETMGHLFIRSEPRGANVSYGIDTERPHSAGEVERLDNLPLGKMVTIILRKDGYEPSTKPLTRWRSGDTIDFGSLTPLQTRERERDKPRFYQTPGSLKIMGNQDADVIIDGKPSGYKTGETISNLVAGRTYNIALHRIGFEDVTQSVTLKSDGSEDIEFIYKQGAPKPFTDEDIQSKLREIELMKEQVQKSIPLSPAAHEHFNNWIRLNNDLYNKHGSRLWDQMKRPLADLKDLVNNRRNQQR